MTDAELIALASDWAKESWPPDVPRHLRSLCDKFDALLAELAAALAASRENALEEAAKIASAHRPPATKRSISCGDDTWETIISEQRGEKIAAEIIAKKIRSLIAPPEDAA